jgi:FtsZ-binding cell division protein ZapB
MRKPPYLSNKKWNKKFQKNVKKFQNLVHPSNEDRIKKPSGLLVDHLISGTTLLKKCTVFLSLLSFVKEAFSYVFVKFIQIINDCRAQEITIVKDLEVRLEKLEKKLKENVEEIQSLRLQVAEHTERLEKLNNEEKTTNMGFLLDKSKLQLADIPTSSIQLPVLPPAPVPFSTSPAPPPPPPPPPPFGALGVKNQLVLKNTSAVRKPSQKPQTMRPAISLEDIISVKLKKTPFAQRNERVSIVNLI